MKSRMKGDFHVRFCESLDVKLLGATRLAVIVRNAQTEY